MISEKFYQIEITGATEEEHQKLYDYLNDSLSYTYQAGFRTSLQIILRGLFHLFETTNRITIQILKVYKRKPKGREYRATLRNFSEGVPFDPKGGFQVTDG